MTLGYVVLQNLRRSPLRTGLTVVAFALPMGIFVLALSLVVSLAQTAEELQREQRLAVISKLSLTTLLPDGVRRKVEDLDPSREYLQAVCGMRWFGGRVPDTQNTLQSLASDVDTLPVVYSEIDLTPAELALWQREKNAAIVAGPVAAQYGWKAGGRVTLESTVPPYLKLDFTVVKVWTKSSFPTVFYFRRDYLADSLENAGFPGTGCSIFWVKCANRKGLEVLPSKIDALFANTPDQTKTEDENAFINGFVAAIGDLPGLARVMALVVVFIIALVAGNTMMMSFRERMRELAVFKAIGFAAWRVFWVVLAESLLLALVGSLVGILPVALALLLVPENYLMYGAFSPPTLSLLAVAGSLAIGLLVGGVAGFWPAFSAWRLRTVDALRMAG